MSSLKHYGIEGLEGVVEECNRKIGHYNGIINNQNIRKELANKYLLEKRAEIELKMRGGIQMKSYFFHIEYWNADRTVDAFCSSVSQHDFNNEEMNDIVEDKIRKAIKDEGHPKPDFMNEIKYKIVSFNNVEF